MKYCDDWPRIRERYEAFWQGEVLDRPLVKVTAPRADGQPGDSDDSQPTDPGDLLDWFTNPKRVIPRLQRQIARTHYAGDAFPLVFPVSPGLVAIQAAYLGGDYRVRSGTAWCGPVIEDWGTRRPLAFDPENTWWRLSKRLLAEGAKAMAGRAAAGIPDLQGGGQILALLRGSARLATDLIEQPDEVRAAVEEIDASFLQYWNECNELILSHQDGYVDWLGVWSDRPMVTVECDFSIMVSPDMFRTFFLPSVRRQTGWIERTIYHLDGPGAIRHLDALLGLETLDGIQWVPGAGAKPMREWIPLLRRIQEGGKLLVLECSPAEVPILLSALQPRGLLLSTRCANTGEADRLIQSVAQHPA